MWKDERTDEEPDNISVEVNLLWRYNCTSNDDMSSCKVSDIFFPIITKFLIPRQTFTEIHGKKKFLRKSFQWEPQRPIKTARRAEVHEEGSRILLPLCEHAKNSRNLKVVCSNNPKHFHQTVSYICKFYSPLLNFVRAVLIGRTG